MKLSELATKLEDYCHKGYGDKTIQLRSAGFPPMVIDINSVESVQLDKDSLRGTEVLQIIFK